MIEVTWEEFKLMIENNIKWIYTYQNSDCNIYGSFGSIDIKCFLKQSSNELTEFETLYKPYSPKLHDVDDQGRQVIRTAATNKGWHYQVYFFEIETASGNIINKDRNGNDLNELSVKRLDINGNITTDTNSAVKTVVTLKRPMDFEIISGTVYQKEKTNVPINLWVTAGLYNEASNYSELSVISFVEGGMNLEYFDKAETDGRSSKYIKHTTAGAPFPTNRFQYTITHPAGHLHKIQIRMDLYKA